MRTLATAEVIPLPVPIDYPLEERAVTCNFLTNTFCPLQETEVVQYTLKMFIESIFYAGIRANIEFRIVDQDNQPVMCLRAGIVIVRGNNARAANTTVLDLTDM
ncbi:hypothetical protein O3G_MSEX011133 [Manduca sexta]|nr:hypothetical protein O3G_MSEX011133 [Manduca sexta]